MKPVKLYIDNFMCYDKGYIDFSKFSSALIVGKVENNDLFSNGVGKTTIFKAIEYVLYNQAQVNLEKIIRDDSNICQIIFDFIVDEQEYRVVRKRTKKGSTDLSLFVRNSVVGDEIQIYHSIDNIPYTDKKDMEKFWKEISGRRAADTEKELEKLIKLNYKAFRSTIHFIQNDFTSLATVTPEKRKGILKEALNLMIYLKLEKVAKDQYATLSKDIDKKKILLESLGDPETDILNNSSQLSVINNNIADKQTSLEEQVNVSQDINNKISLLNGEYSDLEKKFSSLVEKEKLLLLEKSRIETSIKEYQTKKSNASKTAKDLIKEIEELKNNQSILAEIDFTRIDSLTEDINSRKEKITAHNINIQNNILKINELKIPIPKDAVCKHCRQEMSEKHKKECAKRVLEELSLCENSINSSKEDVQKTDKEIINIKSILYDLTKSKQKLEDVNIKITEKNREIQDKKVLFNEYSNLLNKFMEDLNLKQEEIILVKQDLQNSSLEEAQIIKKKIDDIKKDLSEINNKILLLNKDITHLNSNKAVIQHIIDQKIKDKMKKEEVKNALTSLEKKALIYPSVIQAFSSTGIPNIIIQNVLDDLQIESNNLLSQLKPGLQLQFFVEKTQGDGTETDTLDINYTINGKERYYEQLSGAQRLAVVFSLKLGLSFLLQKLIGTNIEFLLLDEIDQSLDKASSDAFADIVKFFQKDYKILVITHNDRLKDKFSHAVLVEQDINMVSKAKVVTSW